MFFKTALLLFTVFSLSLSAENSAEDDDSEVQNPDEKSYIDFTNSTKRSGNTQTCRNCEGCELLFGTGEITDLDSFQFPAITAPPETNAAKQERLKKTFQDFVNLCVGISHLTPPAGGKLVRAGVGIFTSVVALSTGKRDGLWTQIERRVEAKIEQYQTYRHFKDLENNGFWQESLATLRKCPEDITKDDLRFMLRHKLQMFPQNNDDVTFTPYWAVALNSWFMNIVATYLELINNNGIEECSLHEELSVLREDVVNALRSLQSKRWRSIRGHDHVGGGDYMSASLQFKDENTGELWPTTFTEKDQKTNRIQNTKSVLFQKIKLDTIDMIKPIRERFNAILAATAEQRSVCEGNIEDIPASVMDVNYPENCFGTPTDDDEGACLLPCDLYGDSSNWCPNDRAMQGKKKKKASKRRYSRPPSRPSGGQTYDGVIGGAAFGTRNFAWCSTSTSVSKWRACDPDGFHAAAQSLIFSEDWGRGSKKKSKKEKEGKNEE